MHNFLSWLGLDWHWALIPVALVVICVVSYLLMVVWDSFWDWRDQRATLDGEQVVDEDCRDGLHEYCLTEYCDCSCHQEQEHPADDAWAVELHHMNHELAQPIAPEREWDFAVWEVEQANWLADRHAEALRVDEMLTAGEWADPWWIKQPA